MDQTDAIRIVLVGKTGSGKSRTGNSLLGYEGFKTECSMPFVKTAVFESKRYGQKLLVIDTPGFFDNERSDVDTKNEIEKAVHICQPGPHAFILVVPIGRLTKDDLEVFEYMEKLFGAGLFEHTILVFTSLDHWKHIEGTTRDQAIKDYVRSFPEAVNYFIQRIHNRYTFLDTEGSEVEKETTALFLAIEHMIKMNKNGFYSYQHFLSSNITQKMAENTGSKENKRHAKKKGRTNARRKKMITRACSNFERDTDALTNCQSKRIKNRRI